MRQVLRLSLPNRAQTFLNNRRLVADQRRELGTLDIGREWKSARQTRAMGAALKTLQQMMGVRERCMYCVDSHGADIDHFRPKGNYPGHAFEWSNMLLCCTECGRFKGSQFPMAHGAALLLDPTAEDPWQHIDFDPDTGNLTARFDVDVADWSIKGAKTVEVLKLDRREALAAGYVKSYRRLTDIVKASFASLTAGAMTAAALMAALIEADDHGLLGWCFGSIGRAFAPFSDLHRECPRVWEDCLLAVP